jgi:hypothetical protein
MTVKSLSITLLLLALATASCGSAEKLIGTGSSLTGVRCDQCIAGAHPELKCEDGKEIGCFKRTDGTCGWAEQCGPKAEPEKPSCPSDRECAAVDCQYGYQKDQQGCRLCTCNPPPDACAAILCGPGTHCQRQDIVCVKAPCPPAAVCAADQPPVDPCASASCPRGTVCKAQDVVCVKAPCLPVPACVPVDPPVDPCASATCPQGTVCKAQDVVCVKAPCLPVAACVPVDAVTCGGFAARPCPGAGLCEDNPNDSCDPNHGGADCGGLCACKGPVPCPPGQTWDGSTKVCACVPVDPPVACGGFAARPCPGAGVCEDNPNDSCDPNHGGADCGGLCACKGPVPCPPGQTWDGSTKICACVPGVKETCGATVCTDGQVCCNASCGICAPKGAACTAIACAAPPK